MIQDTINSIRVTLNERVGNPFISATLIACAILNWKLSLLLFSDVSYTDKIQKILDLYPDSATRNIELISYPILFGVFWTFVWPLISLGINSYWYWMKSKISNAKIKAERKKTLSEAEAAELYSTIDAQESKYLEFLKDRQSKIENLSKQISDLLNETRDLQSKLESLQSAHSESQTKLSGSQSELTHIKKSLSDTSREKDEQKRALDEIYNRTINIAEYLPGLKAITSAINKTTNYQANEAWMWDEVEHHGMPIPTQARQEMLNFFLAVGLLSRDFNSIITFGERYRIAKDRVLSSNSSLITALD